MFFLSHFPVCASPSLAAVVVVEGLRLQPLCRLRDRAHDEGEALLRGLQHRAGAEASTRNYCAGGIIHGRHVLTFNTIKKTKTKQINPVGVK